MASESLPTQSINLPINGAEEGGYTFTSFLPTDVPAQHAVHSIDSVADKLSAVPKPYSLSDAEFWVSNNVALAELCSSLKTVEERREVLFGQSYGMPMQVIRHKGTMIGCCTCTPKPSPESKYRVELGYYLHPEHQGKGAMSVAARTVLRIAKEEYGVTCVMVAADFENAGSRKVILGLVKHVQMREKKVVTGDFYVKRWPKGKYGESECERECGSWSWEL